MTRWLAPVILLAAVAAAGAGLGTWKLASIEEANAAALEQPEPSESVTAVAAKAREHRDTLTVIGSVLALQSVTLRNELAGTVRRVALVPGAVVEAGTVLVALDVSVEEAELSALEAQAELAALGAPDALFAEVSKLLDESRALPSSSEGSLPVPLREDIERFVNHDVDLRPMAWAAIVHALTGVAVASGSITVGVSAAAARLGARPACSRIPRSCRRCRRASPPCRNKARRRRS